MRGEGSTTLIFDIGKTNKKLFLFDDALNEIYHDQVVFDEITDDDGYPCEDLIRLTEWMRSSVYQLFKNSKYHITKINISAYGASLVHLNKNGEVITPLYNYTKPLPDDFYEQFAASFGSMENFTMETASPLLGMLNSGFQLFYLKNYKPQLYNQISYSLHLPQYLSYLFTGKMVSEYTSIGCHTCLWDFNKMKYHPWLGEFESLLSKIVRTDHTFKVNIEGSPVDIGVGVHDSSSALVPYLTNIHEPFLLISTGTWSISLNPFNKQLITKDEFQKDCLNYLSYSGNPVKACRLFLGKEFSHQVKKIASHFNCDENRYKSIYIETTPDANKNTGNQLRLNYKFLHPQSHGYYANQSEDLNIFRTFEEAYQCLINELTTLQVAAINLTIGNSGVTNIYIDGGFSSNENFIQMLTNKLPGFKIYANNYSTGSALGAAVIVNKNKKLDFFSKYNIKEYRPDYTH